MDFSTAYKAYVEDKLRKNESSKNIKTLNKRFGEAYEIDRVNDQKLKGSKSTFLQSCGYPSLDGILSKQMEIMGEDVTELALAFYGANKSNVKLWRVDGIFYCNIPNPTTNITVVPYSDVAYIICHGRSPRLGYTDFKGFADEKLLGGINRKNAFEQIKENIAARCIQKCARKWFLNAVYRSGRVGLECRKAAEHFRESVNASV